MWMIQKKVMLLIFLFLGTLFFSYCGEQSGTSDAPPVGKTSKYDKMKTKRLYREVCTMCHKMKAPDRYNKKSWKFHVNRMIPDANSTLGVMLSDKVKNRLFKMWKKRKKYGRFARKWNRKQIVRGRTWPIP